jgi:hypothetical protein
VALSSVKGIAAADLKRLNRGIKYMSNVVQPSMHELAEKCRYNKMLCWYCGEYLFRGNREVGASRIRVPMFEGTMPIKCQGNQTEPSMRSNFENLAEEKRQKFHKYGELQCLSHLR